LSHNFSEYQTEIMSLPHIFFAPGMFTGPAVFEDCAERLENAGYTTRLGTTFTTGTKSPGNPTIIDNLARYREDISTFVDEAGEAVVIVVIHSAAGHFCSGSLKGLGTKSRRAVGKPGGVAHLIFISAIIVEEGNAEELVA
jgi:hypothetical protein